MAPGLLMALLAGGGEFFGGLALMVGLLTRPAALVSAFTMLVAIFSVHISNGLFLANGGYELALALLAATVALTLQGAGRLSLDGLLAKRVPARSLRRSEGIAETVHLDHIKAGYHSIKALNPGGSVPAGPEVI